jgi:hypothetical protein
MKVILATDGSQHAEEAAWLLAHLQQKKRPSSGLLGNVKCRSFEAKIAPSIPYS